jgi:hypothetical protein
MKFLFRLFAAAGLAAAALFATLAQANEFGTSLTIRSAPGGGQFCMDASGDRQADGTPVFLYRCHGRENQRWTVTRNVDGTSAITGTGGLCLDVRGHGASDGTPVQLWQCHFGANQRFRVFDDGRIQEVQTGKCLMVLPEWIGDHDHDGDSRFVWEHWHHREFERIRFSERDRAPIIIDDCEPRALQFWSLVR